MDYAYTGADGLALGTVTYKTYSNLVQTIYGWGSTGVGPAITSITSYLNSTTSDVVNISYNANSQLHQIFENPTTPTGPIYQYATCGNTNSINVLVTIPQSGTNVKRCLNFDANGYLTSDTRAFGSTSPAPEATTYSRDSATELVLSITDPLHRVTNFTYDGNNSHITLANLSSVTEAAGTSQAATTNIAWQTAAGVQNMITVDYHISPSWMARDTEPELASADETKLRYNLLLGNIVFKANGHNFSPTWDLIPIVDFATALRQIPDELLRNDQVESVLDFTESGATLHFKRDGEVVTISADYVQGAACVSLEEFNSAVESFVRRVGRELSEQYPSLRRNAAFLRLLPVASA